MYTSYYGLCCNPFLKQLNVNDLYQSNDYKEFMSRLNYIKEIKGLGLFTGKTGYGKTFTIRSFCNELNKDIYKIIYISITKDMNVFDFFKLIADALKIGLGACYKTDLYREIQNEIIRLVKEDKVCPIVIVDDVHNLSKEIILQLKVLFDFEMDSNDYVSLILVGQEEIKDELNEEIYEAIKQRILVNYTMVGLTREEVKEYIRTRLVLARKTTTIFTEEALNALYACSKSSIRRLNSLIINCLMIGYQSKKIMIDEEIVREAMEELELI